MSDSEKANDDRPDFYDAEPDEWEIPWRPVVKAMYDGVAVGLAGQSSKWKFQTFLPMGKKTGLNREEIEYALNYMDNNGLIQVDESRVALTETGLQVAYDISTREQEEQSRRRQNRINRSIMLAAAVTALTSILASWPPDGDLLPFDLPTLVDSTLLFVSKLFTIGGILFGALLLGILIYELSRLYTTERDTVESPGFSEEAD